MGSQRKGLGFTYFKSMISVEYFGGKYGKWGLKMTIVSSCPAFGFPFNQWVAEQGGGSHQVTFTFPNPNPANQVLFLPKPEQLAGVRQGLLLLSCHFVSDRQLTFSAVKVWGCVVFKLAAKRPFKTSKSSCYWTKVHGCFPKDNNCIVLICCFIEETCACFAPDMAGLPII